MVKEGDLVKRMFSGNKLVKVGEIGVISRVVDSITINLVGKETKSFYLPFFDVIPNTNLHRILYGIEE